MQMLFCWLIRRRGYVLAARFCIGGRRRFGWVPPVPEKACYGTVIIEEALLATTEVATTGGTCCMACSGLSLWSGAKRKYARFLFTCKHKNKKWH